MSNVTRIIAKETITLSITCGGQTATGGFVGIYNSSAQILPGHTQERNHGEVSATTELTLENNDYIYIYIQDPSSSYGTVGWLTLVATPQVNDVVLLNSQDEIFTDWVDYTDVFATASWIAGAPNTISKAVWRRVGGNMEIKVDFHVAGTGSASGYQEEEYNIK